MLRGIASSQRLAVAVVKLFDELLPAQCPPASASEQGYEMVFRLVPSNPPSKAHFASKAAEGQRCPPAIDPCSWASCSFFTYKPIDLLKLPRIRRKYNFVAKVKIPESTGRSILKDRHVDYWRYTGVNPAAFVVSVEAV